MRSIIFVVILAVALPCYSQSLIRVSKSNPTCSNLCDGSVTYSLNTSALQPYHCINTNSSCNYSTMTTFSSATVTLTNLCRCDSSYSLSFYDKFYNPLGQDTFRFGTDYEVLVWAYVSKGPSCIGACDGVATTTVFQGTPPYDYQWVPGGSTYQTIPNLCATQYSITVTDANGCLGETLLWVYPPANACQGVHELSGVKKITVSPNPVVDIIHLDHLDELGEDYFISVTNTLGQQVLRQGFAPRVSLSGLEPGLYHLFIVDTIGAVKYCSKFLKE